MLLTDQRNFKLQKRYWKILYAAPALNNSLCFMGMRAHREDCLAHIDANGKTLHQTIFKENTDSFGMLTDRQCAVLQTRQNRIVVWNLEPFEEFYIDFEFKAEQADQSFIDIFADTQSMVVRENGRYNNSTFKLSYFHYPLTKESKPYHVYESNDVWTYEYMTRKANSHSMYVWFKGRHDEGFEFKTYDLREDPKGKYNLYKFANEVGKADGLNKTQVAITTMWEMREKEFMMVCITNRKQDSNNNYVCDTKNGVIREAKFRFSNHLQPLTIDQMSFGSTCMFRTFDFEQGNTLETPVYYINNETEEIIAEDTWKCTYLNKYTFIGTDSNIIVDSEFENGNVENIKVMAKKVMQPMEITVHFLNEIIEDVDDDLLYEACKMIDYSK